MAEKYKVLSTFYLAKQIEESSISNEKYSKSMKNLTKALVFVAVVQVLEPYLPKLWT